MVFVGIWGGGIVDRNAELVAHAVTGYTPRTLSRTSGSLHLAKHSG